MIWGLEALFLWSVQICWENYRAYLTCERFSESNFASLPRASISFLHSTFSNGVTLFCCGHHQSVHVVLLWLTETTTREVTQWSLPSQSFSDSRWIGGHFVCVLTMFRETCKLMTAALKDLTPKTVNHLVINFILSFHTFKRRKSTCVGNNLPQSTVEATTIDTFVSRASKPATLFVLFCFRNTNLPFKSNRIINLLIAVDVTKEEEEEEDPWKANEVLKTAERESRN